MILELTDEQHLMLADLLSTAHQRGDLPDELLPVLDEM